MFVLKRNQVIVTALVIMIAVAGYLNFTDSRVNTSPGMVYTLDSELNAILSDENFAIEVGLTNPEVSIEELTNAEVISDNMGIVLTMNELAKLDSSEDDLETVFVNTTLEPTTFFVQAKLDRENSRSRQQEVLLEMINNQNLDQPQRAQFADAMLDIQKRIEKESAAEAMIESKGFREVFVRIGDDSVDVVVDKENLTDAEVAQIEDIVKRKTGIDVKNIRISTMKRP